MNPCQGYEGFFRLPVAVAVFAIGRKPYYGLQKEIHYRGLATNIIRHYYKHVTY